MNCFQAEQSDGRGEVGSGLFEFEEPLELDEEPLPKPTIKLDGVRVKQQYICIN